MPPPAKPRAVNVSDATKTTRKKPKAVTSATSSRTINTHKLGRAQTASEQDPIVISDDETPAPSSSRPAATGPQLSLTAKSKIVKSSNSVVVKTTAATNKKGKTKEKLPLMTPPQYVQMLLDKFAAGSIKYDKHVCLEGLTLFYTGGDMTYASERTRARMEIILKQGGNLLPQYDATTVTHIVTDAQMHPTLRALGLKKLNQIPNHIPTVTWKWVLRALDKGSVTDKTELYRALDQTWLHAAFSQRIDAGAPSTRPSARTGQVKGKAKEAGTVPDGPDFSRISEFTPDKSTANIRSLQPRNSEQIEAIEDASGAPLSPPASPGRVIHRGNASSSKVQLPVHQALGNASDPLAEFYAQARIEREAGVRVPRKSDVSEGEAEVVSKAPRAKRGFTCDNKDARLDKCPNQDIIDQLQELLDIHQSKPGQEDRWRVLSYSKSIRALRTHPKRIKTLNEARNIQGIGEKTAMKIMEIIETGKLRRIQFERTEDVEVTRMFQGIYGVGQSTAQKWYANGCRTLEDLTSGKYGVKLTPAQEIGIRYYDAQDINSRMPRSEAKAIFELIKPIALEIDPGLFVEIMGSYRRGKADCGDIDILITRNPDDGRSHAGKSATEHRILRRLFPALRGAGIITEDLALPDDPSEEEVIYRGLCHLPQEGSRQRRIDFLTVPWKSKGAALLYYTGDDVFNRAMRLKANVLGYSLNQRGLFSGVVRDPRDRRVKLNQGTLIASETEEEIFHILGVPWQEPHERMRG
ncbi:hypothetical protein BDN72DRAFT_762389 [Pluteus cervinus]|uniref:Uncharacterized protein n=1 Tax=Pluteus cervinus TaxID=181527 RepID=A0ACD3B4U4_9AGAR|nr:hypothetical protein BDN72DRAFT_762389 [Pluteus cervinus]